VGTAWSTGEVWLRRGVEIAEELSNPHLVIHHDEDAEVYINGRLAGSFKGYTTSYAFEPLSAESRGMLLKGANTIAVHCRQTRGGQYIDVGLADVAAE
jgi:hypothetical protein